MARQSKESNERNIGGLPTGYGNKNVAIDYHLPVCGIEQIDTAMYNLFDKDLSMQILINDDDGNLSYKHKVPVVFSAGEIFATYKKDQPIRDRQGMLILPIISIRRTSIDQSKNGEYGYGLAQNTGNFKIKKKLSKKDRTYQNLVNPEGIQNQDNVSSISHFINNNPRQDALPGTTTKRRVQFAGTSINDNLLDAELSGNHIYETISIPFPKFVTINYEIEIWTSYAQHMNQILEKIMTNYDGQGNNYRIRCPEGYWFVSYFEDNIDYDDHSDELGDSQRHQKSKFNVKVQGYLIGNRNDGDEYPVRRTLSSPKMIFGVYEGIYYANLESPAPSGDLNKFVLSDLKNLKLNGEDADSAPNDWLQSKIVAGDGGKVDSRLERIKFSSQNKKEETISSREFFNIEIE